MLYKNSISIEPMLYKISMLELTFFQKCLMDLSFSSIQWTSMALASSGFPAVHKAGHLSECLFPLSECLLLGLGFQCSPWACPCF
uniref:Uncharacterized protein n=1 Tax=Picea glauca TaxID=3330 RepID=A0A101M0Y2_PICGL|nr:hypothetical protein ABT39_MTgene4245 [Picea glauca]